MTKKESRTLLQDHAPNKYHSTIILLLKRLVDLTYNPKVDEVEREMRKRLTTVQRGVGVRTRQFLNLLDTLKHDGILEYRREEGMLTYKLNLKPLAGLPNESDTTKERNSDRAAKARAQRAAKRDRNTNALALLIAAAAASGWVKPEELGLTREDIPDRQGVSA